MLHDYDVIIIGAGPAGSSAGIVLYESRLKTLVVEVISGILTEQFRFEEVCSIKKLYTKFLL